MKVSRSQPSQVVYALFEHEYLGYLFESFMVQLDTSGKLTLKHQNISSHNAREFTAQLDHIDFELIELMDSMQQDVVVRKFYEKKIKPSDFFIKCYSTEKGKKLYKPKIDSYLETKRAKVLELIQQHSKPLFEMGNDGEPTQKRIEVIREKAKVLFHFWKNEDNTHYFPTIKSYNERVDFKYKGAFLVCNQPAWMICRGKLYGFAKHVDGKKLKPFFNKKFVLIPKAIEEKYYNTFVANLVANYNVHAEGFMIQTENYLPLPVLRFSELKQEAGASRKMLFELFFRYGEYMLKSDGGKISVKVERIQDEYIFHRLKRDRVQEARVLEYLEKEGVSLVQGEGLLEVEPALEIIGHKKEQFLEDFGIQLEQGKATNGHRYFVGVPSIAMEVSENIDWFDIKAIIKFGEYEIPFKELRKYIISKQGEFLLPNGEIAVIPMVWRTQYSELLAFLDEGRENDQTMQLKKHHIALLHELEDNKLAKVQVNRKLQQLIDFEQIEDTPLPAGFDGQLRPYQKAGYNWLRFLNQYNFGGCLADDMGLGKTVQTLALLQAQKEEGKQTSLLIMPTSLVYNWQKEAKKFTPDLKVFTYTGTGREKDTSRFKDYDLVLTIYGIARLDVDILSSYYFNYIILDESQNIKNPNSGISRAVGGLNSNKRLVLTGTPLENSTLDLWSQMNFVNPGLLGDQPFFKNEFLTPIEKKADEAKTRRLYSLIKPFILRRHKSQVATELPGKVIQVKYSIMTEDQEKHYEEAKASFRNQILDKIEEHGVNKSQFLLLQGLTKLRQIANHPKMVDHDYDGDSGKLKEIKKMVQKGIQGGHKILVFSQFVKHLDLVRSLLDNEEVPYAYLDGTTRNRQEQVEKFQNDPDVRVFLISMKAGGVGLNLTKADYVFILDPWWNPAVEAQAVDRAHRIGQRNKVFTYKFIGKNTIEEKILALQNKKKSLAENLIATEESFVKELTKEDIESLLA